MIKVAVFGIVASLIAMKIKTIRPEIAVVIAVISSILLAMYGLKQMEEILTVFEMIRSYSKIPQSYFQILLKLIGISFICEFASNICKDAGQASIAKQIEFAGKDPETIRKWHMKQRIFLLTLLFLLILTRTNDISAKETKLNEDMFTNVENTLKDKEIDLSYTQLVKQLIHGNVKGVLHTIKAKMKEVFLNRMLIQKDLIREILLIAFTAAIFKNLSDSFFQQSTANSAFYITYVILCGVMVHSFFYLNKTVTQLVTLMADYMKGMIMAYSLAVVSTSGITTSTTVYEFYLLLIYAMTTLTNVVLLPMIKILFVLKIINHISKEEHFSRLCKTLEGVIKFLLKGFLSILLGVQLIQSMILPAVDSMKNTVLQKGMSAIPGIGSGLNSAMTMVIGSAVVIKNSIGAVGILVLIVIIVPPVIEITAVVLTYLLAGIMIQPISDKRITGAMDAVIQSGKLMLSMIFTMALLFILSVALIAFSTNVNYYAG